MESQKPARPSQSDVFIDRLSYSLTLLQMFILLLCKVTECSKKEESEPTNLTAMK